MKMFSIWKLLRKIQGIRIRGPFICHMPLACWTWSIPLRSFVWHRSGTEKTFLVEFPFTYIMEHFVRSTLVLFFVMSCFMMLCLLYIYCFFPLFSPVDPETDAAPVIDYVIDDPSLPEQPGKPPLWSSRYRPFHSLMLALDFATVIVCSYSDA